ncbi:hypothetical protein R1flu_004862 [Riccia fluitans]|uniref:Peroxiredoxin-like 2A n=1 Tax=Riccia fluitans TaxID=41844 RepID=A0ABD1YS46_9MARC
MSHSSFSLEEFAGNGVLNEILDDLTADGWDDVPTLKKMTASDMDSLRLTEAERDALELRLYLHDRNLMQYGNVLESSGERLRELLNISPSELVSNYGMRRGHVARFHDRLYATSAGSLASNSRCPEEADVYSEAGSYLSRQSESIPAEIHNFVNDNGAVRQTLHKRHGSDAAAASSLNSYNRSYSENDVVPIHGIVANKDSPARLCGLIRSRRVMNDVTPLSILEKIYVQRLAPEYKKGMMVTGGPETGCELSLLPPMKAAELWAHRPVVFLCVRRPGCLMCRAEAHRLYARKSIFDSYNIQLVAVLNEHIDSEVKEFWPRYWGGMVVVDRNRDFFKALGAGKLRKGNLITGFFFNRQARRNWKRATATGFEYNNNGEGHFKGGMYILGPGKTGVAYQFIERTFGDWAPLEEVLDVCNNLQKQPLRKESLSVHHEEKPSSTDELDEDLL